MRSTLGHHYVKTSIRRLVLPIALKHYGKMECPVQCVHFESVFESFITAVPKGIPTIWKFTARHSQGLCCQDAFVIECKKKSSRSTRHRKVNDLKGRWAVLGCGLRFTMQLLLFWHEESII